LVGFDTKWQNVGDKRSVTFTNLFPGTYTFKVKASNGDGFWDPEERNIISIVLTIAPPWWRTWWFTTLVILCIAGLITAFYHYRIRQIQERETLKTNLNQRIAQVKMEALRSQMNPHFVFNCLSSLKLFVEKNETEKASDHISKFATLLRRVLDDARTDTETVTLERELDTLRRYVELEMIRFKDKFEFRMDIDPNLDTENLELPPLILQPYVENALLHGLQHKTNGKGLLLIQVRNEGDFCKITVEDNGIGREAAKAIKARNPILQKSHGLNVSAERLEYFSQKYQIQANVETVDLYSPDSTPAGTRLVLTIQTN
jgi:sensor histidine kinase YesM